MIDEKKIKEAAKEYADNRPIIINCGANMGFQAGIDWFKKNIWHDVKEQPKVDELLIVQYIKEHRVKYMMLTYNSLSNYNWREHRVNYNITKWCYLKDLI